MNLLVVRVLRINFVKRATLSSRRIQRDSESKLSLQQYSDTSWVEKKPQFYGAQYILITTPRDETYFQMMLGFLLISARKKHFVQEGIRDTQLILGSQVRE